jgi:hypothetical protein
MYIQIREGHEWAETKDGLGPTLEKGINKACNRANEKQKWTYNCGLVHQLISAYKRSVSRT